MDAIRSAIRRAEYTGEQQCWPCTVLNSVFAFVCGSFAYTHRRVATLYMDIIGVAAIVFRGYLVPYAPWLAPRLVGWFPVGPFHTEDTTQSESLVDEADGETVLETLIVTGVLVLDGNELQLRRGIQRSLARRDGGIQSKDPRALAESATEHTLSAIDGQIIEETDVFGATEDR